MGRKSKAEERRSEILDAFEKVILREGYANASQRKIADEAGLNQPMIHHYFKGGDDLLEAFLDRIVERYRSALEAFVQSESSPSLENVLAFLSSETFHKVSMQNEVMFILIAQTSKDDDIMEKLSGVYQQLFSELLKYLELAGVKNAEQISYTLMCLIIGHDWAKKLGFGEQRNDLMSSVLLRITKDSA